MRELLRVYSKVLTLDDRTYRMIKQSRAAVPFALLLFLTMTLIAGCGRWLALPGVVNRPILSEQIGIVSDVIDNLFQRIIPEVEESLLAVSQENLSFQLGELLPEDESVTPEALARLLVQSGLTGGQLLELVREEVTVPARTAAELREAPLDAAAIETLLSETNIDAVELKEILTRASLASATGEGIAGIPISSGQLQDILVNLALAPEQLRALTVRLGLPPERVAELTRQVEEVPEQAQGILDVTRQSIETLEPPLGVRASQTFRLLGQWLASPFVIMAGWLPLVLVGLLIAKVLGGTGTITQHLVAAALAVAPAFLLFFSFGTELANSFPLTVAAALVFLGRLLALVAFVWAIIILIKGMSVAHEFSTWRAVATIALTYAAVYLVLPALALSVGTYLLRG